MTDDGSGFTLVRPPTGAVTLRAALLGQPGVCHAFGTRVAGDGRLSALSFRSDQQGDDDLALLAGAVGFDAERLVRVRQVHGSRALVVEGETELAALAQTEADALVSAVPGVTLAVQTADCVPVLLFDPGRRVVGAAHAGWRGLRAGVLGRTVETMATRFDCRPQDLLAAVGPSIGRCCFEVGEEVADAFADHPGAIVRVPGGRPHVDLPRVAGRLLTLAGLAGERVAVTRLSTCCRRDLFFSYRKEGPETGRMLSVIGLR